MRSKILCILLSLIMILSILSPTALADDTNEVTVTNTLTSVKINITAQLDETFLCAPLLGVNVSAGKAEEYGYTDKVDGVSVLDALVAIHEAVFGDDFTQDTASMFLEIGSYGSASVAFGISSETDYRYSGFVLNGECANNGTESDYGGYNCTVETTQKLSSGDTVEFFVYSIDYSDKLVWFTQNEVVANEIVSAPDTEVKLKLQGIPFSNGYLYKDADEIHKSGSAVSGAKLAYVSTDSGVLTDIDGAITGSDGSVSFTSPKGEGTYYLSAYMPTSSEEANLIMPLIPLVVKKDSSSQKPYFESLEFASTAFGSGVWVKGETFSKTKFEYSLPIKNATTSTLTLLSSTVYDDEKYTAIAEYTNVDGQKEHQEVKSAQMTMLKNQPFDSSVMKITLTDKLDPGNKTVYTFNVTRPRDEEKKVKNGGIVVTPDDRSVSASLYKGISECALQRYDNDGESISGTGATGNVKNYRAFVYDDVENFSVLITSSTNYAHIRYSLDNGESWSIQAQKSTAAEKISIGDKEVSVLVQILDDKTYHANVVAGKDGFDGTSVEAYTLTVYKVTRPYVGIVSATADNADFYPKFDTYTYSYKLMVANNAAAPILKFKVTSGATVKVGKNALEPDGDGVYSLTLTTGKKSITVTDAESGNASTYTFSYGKRSALDTPDRVVDYLCIGSQYTNGSNGKNPEASLSGNLISLGNFGGYVIYYYEDGIEDDPYNKYGMDFYVIGNSDESNIDSMAELGQVYVSEDGNKWYALAGSEHYDEKAIWDYSITYTKGADGKAYWSDNYGNTIDYSAYPWPSGEYYSLNDVSNKSVYTFDGILFKCQDGTVVGNSSSQNSYAASASFGYVDYYASNLSGLKLEDVNPYVKEASRANGFDILWAVDENGEPIDVEGRSFHYIKIATASNIKAGSFGEKSTEVTYTVRTTPQTEKVGKTSMPLSVTISDGVDSKVLKLDSEKNIYTVELDDMKYVSINVSGADDIDNVYINGKRADENGTAYGFKVTREKGEVLVRIIAQSGDKEPYLCLLKLKSEAEETDELIEGIKINALGNVRTVSTDNGIDYVANVGYRIDEISIGALTADNIDLKINGNAVADKYTLVYGENTFEICASDKDERSQTVKLTVTRENAPISDGQNITVSFTLYGDKNHGDDVTHTFKENSGSLPVWIRRVTYTVESDSTVLDVFETALDHSGLTYTNAGGNYISEINGLSEFDNGSLSGWMYAINGTHTVLGLSEQPLRDGDDIVFHYTDDYTKEDDFEYFKDNSSNNDDTTFTVKFETNGGSDIEDQTVVKNGKVNRPGDPTRDGFDFAGWFTSKKLTRKYDFDKKVTNDLILYAKWEKSPDKDNDADKDFDGDDIVGEPSASESFEDVSADAWYREGVDYVNKLGLFKGVTENMFAPDEYMTRAMLTVVLYRLDGEQATDFEHGFTDVDSKAWYADAVSWAAENGIVNGMSESKFAPDENVTREQVATILYRYAIFRGLDTSLTDDLSGFDDADRVSEWAVKALEWASGANIITGIGDKLSPDTTATRAQVATIFMRFCELLAK